MPANPTFMILVGDISNSLTSTFENQKDLDPAPCDLGAISGVATGWTGVDSFPKG